MTETLLKEYWKLNEKSTKTVEKLSKKKKQINVKNHAKNGTKMADSRPTSRPTPADFEADSISPPQNARKKQCKTHCQKKT